MTTWHELADFGRTGFYVGTCRYVSGNEPSGAKRRRRSPGRTYCQIERCGGTLVCEGAISDVKPDTKSKRRAAAPVFTSARCGTLQQTSLPAPNVEVDFVAEKEHRDEPPWTMDADRKPLCERTIRNYMTAANEIIAEVYRQ